MNLDMKHISIFFTGINIFRAQILIEIDSVNIMNSEKYNIVKSSNFENRKDKLKIFLL